MHAKQEYLLEDLESVRCDAYPVRVFSFIFDIRSVTSNTILVQGKQNISNSATKCDTKEDANIENHELFIGEDALLKL